MRPLGLGYVDADNRLVPVHRPQEFFILNEKLTGYDYFQDLERIRQGDFRPSDVEQARAFARWLGQVHATRKDDPDLYYRHVRNLLGASECIMGLIDEAFPHPCAFLPEVQFVALEKRLIDWRWVLRGYAHRLCAVHGDFHPWNILVDGAGEFSVLDRSRGEWGEPAGDVATLAANYLLFGLLAEPESGSFGGSFEVLYRAFFEEYLDQTGDAECLRVMAPFFVFRALVIVSPEWYPNHPEPVRRALVRFLTNVLEDEVFDWQNLRRYLE